MKPNILIGILLSLPITIPAFSASIPDVPHFVTTNAFPNIMIDMSVETPMGGAAYADQKDNPPGCPGRSTINKKSVGACYYPSYKYLGIFDPNKCYVYETDRFVPASLSSFETNGKYECLDDDHPWSGNFLNWANMTAIDMFIWTMTGGNRIVDTTSSTILERARVHNNSSWYPVKYIEDASNVSPFSGSLYIRNHDQGGYKFSVGDSYSATKHGSFKVRVSVCVPNLLEDNCTAYEDSEGNIIYKPEGLIQRNMDRMRFGVFAYTKDNSQERDGGVLRAPMRYVGAKKMDSNGNLINNPGAEVNTDNGILVTTPISTSKSRSGVINYINKFHYDGYKSYDPVGEMFYEVIRYFKNIGRTPEYADGAPSDSFDIFKDWNDPIEFSCQKNFVVAINDANPWLDKKLPGTFFTCDKAGKPGLPSKFKASDCGEPSNPDSSINVATLTQKVGQLEGLHTHWAQNNSTGEDGIGYVYNVTSNAGDCSSKTVSDLGKVMGTCPYPPKQNSYYIAGLAYYANTTDLRPDIDGFQNLNTFMIDTQEYSPNPLSGPRNMLYLAGKYGGFYDLNNNKEPDLKEEWDADNDGYPDNYVFASQPEKLVSGLERAFKTILEKTGSIANVSVNSTQVASDTRVFQAKFNSGSWTGELLSFPITNAGISSTASWNAAQKIPTADSRNIFTRDATGKIVTFEWANLNTDDRNSIGSEDILNYIRGDRSNEGTLRSRGSTVLGDIIHSMPAYVSDTDTIYVGANDGMLHAIDANPTTGGTELAAYVPRPLFSKLKQLTLKNYAHKYFVDGQITVTKRSEHPQNKNILVATLGRGGKGLFSTDVTNRSAFSGGWDYFGPDDDLGFILGSPIIAKLNNGKLGVVTGNGYNSNSGKAVLYIFDLGDGSIISKLDTHAAGDNGLSQPALYDKDGDGDIDFVYAGDLKGNVWKFDISSSNPSSWKVAYGSDSAPEPLFISTDPDGNRQPITSPISLAVNYELSDPNFYKLFLFWGTGSYIFSTDPMDTQIQSWYGVIDDNEPIDRDDLMERKIESTGTVSGHQVRSFEKASFQDMKDKKGWYIDLPAGERIVTKSKYYNLVEPTLFVSSIMPKSDPCLPGGIGYLNAVNPFTGASLTSVIFDLNSDNEFDEEDMLNDEVVGSVDPKIGMPSEPVLVGDRIVVGGSSGNIASIKINLGTALYGRIMWREIILEQ